MRHPDCRFIGWSSALWRSPQICRSPKGENMVGMPDILNASILIVDDQESNVSLLERLLGEAGYTRVASTLNPQEVCALHRKNGYDLIMLDL
jgi:PleD family two-component response regulator